MPDLVSIIVPVYNAEPYLPECIESILAQSETSFELVMIDDGSTDASASICKQYQTRDKRIRYFFQENAGANRAREAGVQKANGDWILFVDADDTIHPDALKVLLSRTGNAKLVMAEMDRYERSPVYGLIPAEQYLALLLKRKINLASYNKLFRKDFFRSFVFDIPSNIVIGEDMVMNVRLACEAQKQSAQVCILSDVLYYYRPVPTSIINQRKWSFGDVFCVQRALADSFTKKPKALLRSTLLANLRWSIASRIRLRTRLREWLKS
jgi:glycosyltransferase involved in cell wall biosynthesis